MFKYRHLIAVIIIVIIIIILDIILENITNNSIKGINKKLSKINSLLLEIQEEENEEKIKKVRKTSKEMIKEWNSHETFLSCYIEHDQIEKIDSKIKVINTLIIIKNYRRCYANN